MAFELVLLWTIAITLLILTPGPAVLMVGSQAARYSWRAGIYASCGVLLANALYGLLAIAGLGAVLMSSQFLFEVIKYSGAAYLIYLGLREIISSFRKAEAPTAATGHNQPSSQSASESSYPAKTVTGPDQRVGRSAFLKGLISQLANPKSVISMGAMLPQFTDPSGSWSLTSQMLLLLVICTVIELPVLAFYAWLARTGAKIGGRYFAGPKLKRWQDRLSGGLLVAIGAGVASVRRPAGMKAADLL
ncbi:LysE family translocator [Rhodovibrionaceae bacterium A322]